MMARTRTDLLKELINMAQSLPADKLIEVLDFAGYLQQRRTDASRDAPGSAEALLAHAGAFRLESGELDS